MKTKPRVEDGIFGTSGGIGFTKQNELFVGRVAMIGFAVSLFYVVVILTSADYNSKIVKYNPTNRTYLLTV